MPYIPAGTYRARPIDLSLTESKAGNPYIQGKFEPKDMPGTTLYWIGLLTEGSRDITFKAARLCGWRGTDLADIQIDANTEVLIVVENEEYNNKQHSKVKWVNSTQGKKVEGTLDPIKAKAFAASMRGAILAFDQKHPEAKQDTTEPLDFGAPF